MGHTQVETNAGGFIGTPHLPVTELLESAQAREEYLAMFAKDGIELTGLLGTPTVITVSEEDHCPAFRPRVSHELCVVQGLGEQRSACVEVVGQCCPEPEVLLCMCQASRMLRIGIAGIAGTDD